MEKENSEWRWAISRRCLPGVHLCVGLLWAVMWPEAPEGQRRPCRAGSTVCMAPRPPCPCRWEVCGLTVYSEDHWAQRGIPFSSPSGACCWSKLPPSNKKSKEVAPFVWALTKFVEFVVYRKEAPLGVRTQTPKEIRDLQHIFRSFSPVLMALHKSFIKI